MQRAPPACIGSGARTQVAITNPRQRRRYPRRPGLFTRGSEIPILSASLSSSKLGALAVLPSTNYFFKDGELGGGGEMEEEELEEEEGGTQTNTAGADYSLL